MDNVLGSATDRNLRAALKSAIHRSRYSPDQIAEQLTVHLGRKVNVSTLYSWESPSKFKWRMPADCVPALCAILEDNTMLRQMLGEQMKAALAIGELVIEAHGSLEGALAEVKKLLKPAGRNARGL